MENAETPKKSVEGIFSKALMWSPIVLIVLATVAFYFYRDVFSGTFSDNSQDWSAFGSYVGGIFGPLVSFVALLAVLKTIGLQKELLDTQRREFDVMQDLQNKTFNSQQGQIDDSKERFRVEALERLKDSMAAAIDRRIAHYDSRFGRAFTRFERYKDTENRDGRGIADSLWGPVKREIAICEENIQSLQELAADIAIKSFGSAEELRAIFLERNKLIQG